MELIRSASVRAADRASGALAARCWARWRAAASRLPGAAAGRPRTWSSTAWAGRGAARAASRAHWRQHVRRPVDFYYHLDLEPFPHPRVSRCTRRAAAAGRLAVRAGGPGPPAAGVAFTVAGYRRRSHGTAAATADRRSSRDHGRGSSAPAAVPSRCTPTRQGAQGARDRAGGSAAAAAERCRAARSDYVITLCDRVREVCPEFRGRAEQMHWSIPDPAASAVPARTPIRPFKRMAAELDTRIGFLLGAPSARGPHTHRARRRDERPGQTVSLCDMADDVPALSPESRQGRGVCPWPRSCASGAGSAASGSAARRRTSSCCVSCA